MMAKLIVQNTPITILTQNEKDYISLNDMATAKDGDNRSADILENGDNNRKLLK